MTENKYDIAIFDFCETIVSFQSADAYVKFTCEHFPNTMVRIRHFFYKIIEKYRVIRRLQKYFHISIDQKKVILHQLKGLEQSVMEESARRFYQESIKPNLIKPTIDELVKYQNQGVKTILLSGAYDIYLRYFAREYGIEENDIISSKLAFEDGKFIGKMEYDCMGENKKHLLESYLGERKAKMIVYTDCISDLPIMQYCEKAVAISKNHHQEWIDEYGFDEIIWK